jgi:hypothetical protein
LVSELLDQNGAWKADLLEQYFIPMDIAEIMKIKPSGRLLDDQLAWAPDRHGLFTVKSAHGLAMDEIWRSSNVSSSSVPHGRRKVWDLVWKSDVPPNVQIFLGDSVMIPCQHGGTNSNAH